MTTNRIISALLALSLVSSCAPSLSQTEKNSLKAIQIPEGRIKSAAYHPPQSITQESAATIGFVSGLTLGLVGGAIAGAGVAVKQNGFETKHKGVIELVKAGTPTDLGKMVSTALSTQLSTDPFFGPRLKAQGPAGRIVVEIANYTLQKVNSTNHSPSLGVVAKITGPSGGDYYMTFSGANGYSRAPLGVAGCSAPLATYAANPALLRSHYEKVAAQAAANLARVLKEEVGEDEEEEEEPDDE